VNEPAVSVVVATHNRPARLARLLAALRAQDSQGFEVIVVDDGSGPETAAVLERELARRELALRVIGHPVARGPAAARNAGWSQARAEFIAFTDDDCTPAPGWLTAALELHAQHPAAIIQGPTEPDPSERGQLTVFSHTVRQTKLGPNYETCNVFYPRSVLAAMDGFDETFAASEGRVLRPVGEDTDLAWRALEAGHTAMFAPGAIVFHAVEDVGPVGALRLAARWTPSIRVLADHPQTRVVLERGVFWNVWHYLLWRSILLLAAPAWLRRPLLLRYLLQLAARGRDRRAGPWAVPFFILHDAVECAAVFRGAVRYRTLVL
jgi:glycosyltransferase involved in cell wall biosynthesis